MRVEEFILLSELRRWTPLEDIVGIVVLTKCKHKCSYNRHKVQIDQNRIPQTSHSRKREPFHWKQRNIMTFGYRSKLNLTHRKPVENHT